MRVLIVEDDVELASALAEGLRDEGFSVDVAYNGVDGLHEARSGEHDVLILDVMLPQISGFEILEKLREEQHAIPTLVLSARTSVEDRVTGLRLGGDDYLCKPFDFDELLARVHVLIRRSGGSSQNTLSWRELELDLAARTVRWAESEIDLTPREFALLEALLLNQGSVLSRTQLIEHIYDHSFDCNSNIIDAHVANLRKKFAPCTSDRIVETKRGLGFFVPKEAE